ncbi:SPX domain-containing protein 4 isoform X2 [Ananas comosus]|uniref:SPX domain-containing protein 4 isoform X2 n=2 Tax=Ananas comosus TaxID=4615 RepID=A0A6P5G8Y7_ANACO|nr:SPX domain-containing protein 4 isoform X2 [Ananas comosus]
MRSSTSSTTSTSTRRKSSSSDCRWMARRSPQSMRIRITGLVACWWVIWTVRNEAIFRTVQPDPPRAVYKIKQLELKERIEKLKANKNGAFASESEFSEEMLEIRKDFVTIHGEMVLLKNYSSLNFAGLVKILKKYDKRTGGLLSVPFTQRALHQPFFTTEPLTRLVHECENNLELLFPLEAEVMDSDLPGKDGTRSGSSGHRTSCVQEETADVYRSTLAAMKAIQGLRKASSTYNPLSLAQFFHCQDDENGAGTVTTANSPSGSFTT